MEVMLDLETLATDQNAQIISIGAVKFNKDGLGSEFYQTILMEGNSKFSVNPQTVSFWLHQSKEAQEALWNPEPKRLEEVLRMFVDWYKGRKEVPAGVVTSITINTDGNEIELLNPGTAVWGNGSTFDNVILRNAFEKLKIKCPWSFREDRDFRTIVALNKHRKIPYERIGTLHNALDDAKTQASHLVKLGVLI
jgi:exodeoxyribonuclease VIII